MSGEKQNETSQKPTEGKIVSMCEDMKPRKHDDASYKQMLKEQEQLRKPHTK